MHIICVSTGKLIILFVKLLISHLENYLGLMGEVLHPIRIPLSL